MMAFKYMKNTIYVFGTCFQYNLTTIPSCVNCINKSLYPVRYYKHYNPKYKKERKAKFIKVDLPDEKENFDYDTLEGRRKVIKLTGIDVKQNWKERLIFLGSTTSVIDSYVVPEGDGKYSVITKEGAKQKVEHVKMKGKSSMDLRKIKKFEYDFQTSEFVQEALEIYKNAHQCLADNGDPTELSKYVTEYGLSKMMYNRKNKIIKWKFLESLEPARVVHVRTQEMMSKDDVFGQITVRFHTQQMLSIYDRFGRLMQGSEILKKDVLDYVVFEKYLSFKYGVWRIHDKIVPPWVSASDEEEKTYELPPKNVQSHTGVDTVL